MTECNTQPLLFSSLKSQKTVADFEGGRLTSDAGGLAVPDGLLTCPCQHTGGIRIPDTRPQAN
jgi:hypothetical protein